MIYWADTPEYNGGYPASLKNVIDLLDYEWHRKPVVISTVTSGAFGASQVLISLQFILWKSGHGLYLPCSRFPTLRMPMMNQATQPIKHRPTVGRQILSMNYYGA
jgi:NADPH-dependent FMN reductase